MLQEILKWCKNKYNLTTINIKKLYFKIKEKIKN